MSKNSSEPLILLDSDVIRHFINGGKLERLAEIYPNRFIILDKVKHEICRSVKIKPIVEAFIKDFSIAVLPFPIDMKIIMEYAYLSRDFGVGESACMAVAKYQHQFIASSNLKDIAKFCTQNNITYLSTMDILKQALSNSLFTKAECDQFIKDVLLNGSKLPFATLDEFLKHKKL